MILTHLRGAQSFALGRSPIASSRVNVEDYSHAKSTAIDQIKTTEGDFADGRFIHRSAPALATSRHSRQMSEFELGGGDSSEVEAVVSIQVVERNLPVGMVVGREGNEIHADQSRNIHQLPAEQVPLGQQWHLLKQFIVSDYYFGELDELAKQHFLQKMLEALISQSQEWRQEI